MNLASLVSTKNGAVPALTLAVASALAMLPGDAAALDLTGWTCQGTCGSLGANGVVTAPPVGTTYGWVATRADGPLGLGLPGIGGVGRNARNSLEGGAGGPTTGSRIRSPLFSASAGQELTFFFNYVTSDGAGFADYGWARLLDSANNEVVLLFTSRTTAGGDTVPGFAMPVPAATLSPASTPIIGGAPAWTPLGGSSGTCFATGCGHTGWIQASFNVPSAGQYRLEIGTVNWDDTNFQSGLAFANVTLGGTPITPPLAQVVPVPVLSPIGLAAISLSLMAAGAGALRRRRRSKAGPAN